jgi:hypothetical protein
MLQHAAKAIGTASCVLMLIGDATHGCNSWRIAAHRLKSQYLSLFNRTEIDPIFRQQNGCALPATGLSSQAT